jgi:hypothetical protein
MPQPTPLRRGNLAAPGDLGESEAALYDQITRAYGIKDEASVAILQEGLRSLQIARECNEAIRAQGRIIFDGRDDLGRGIGKQRLNPLCNVERDSRAAALAGFKQRGGIVHVAALRRRELKVCVGRRWNRPRAILYCVLAMAETEPPHISIH